MRGAWRKTVSGDRRCKRALMREEKQELIQEPSVETKQENQGEKNGHRK